MDAKSIGHEPPSSAAWRTDLAPADVLASYPPHALTINSVFQSRLKRRARERFLLVPNGLSYTWEGFQAEALALASLLGRRGVQRGDRLAIVAENDPAHVLLLCAAAYLGAVMVPINPQFGVAETSYVLGHAQVSGVFTATPSRAIVQAACGRAAIDPWIEDVGTLRLALSRHTPLPASVTSAQPTDPCLIIYTSGSTGPPKGVVHSQRNYVLCGEVAVGRVGLMPHDRALIVLPLFHINALMYSLGSVLLAGACAVLPPRFSASSFWAMATETGATQVNVIETIGSILASRPRSEFRADHKIRTVYGLRPAAEPTFRNDFHISRLIAGYGMTECPAITCSPADIPNKPGSMGQLGTHPRRDTWCEAKVVDADGGQVADGVIGELTVKSPIVMDGYFRDPVLTTAVLADRWLKTGDMVYRDADGFYFFVSRSKDIIRRRGENISALEIERALARMPGVRAAAVIAVPSELGEDEILAAIVPEGDATLDAQAISTWMKGELSPAKAPRFIVFLPQLPLTPTHKIAKQVLREDPSLITRAVDVNIRR